MATHSGRKTGPYGYLAASQAAVAVAVIASTAIGWRPRNATAADAASRSPQPAGPGGRLAGWLSTAPRVP